MVNQELLREYSDNIRRLRSQCADAGVTEEEFQRMYQETLNSLDSTLQEAQNRRRTWKYKVIFLSIIVICCAYSIKCNLLCDLQEFIYPGLRLLRRLTIPIISLFPSLTDLYHETCLIQNPFFTVVDMDCWPCSAVNNIRQMHDPQPVTEQHNAPFIYESDQHEVNLETLENLYTLNKDIFHKESKVSVNNKHQIVVHDMFQSTQESVDNNFYVWKFNSMNVARILRHIIPRPKVVPKFGQSTERFIIIDSGQNSFQIPDTECSFSFLLMLSGSRTVNLRPAEECRHQCRTLKVEMKKSYLLWYNWWYWRPIVQPSYGNDTLIVHVGSYC